MNNRQVYSKDLDQVLAKEWEYIQKRRQKAAAEKLQAGNPSEVFNPQSPIGLSFSGGGLRSATFNLGVVQALAKHRILPYVDYLSTVSGGGYLGSSLTTLLNLHRHDQNATGFCEDDCEAHDDTQSNEPLPNFPFTTQHENFPLNPAFNLFKAEAGYNELKNKNNPDQHPDDFNPQLDHMRRVGNFLIQKFGLLSRDFVRTIGAVLSGIIYSVALFGIVLFLLSAVHYGAMGILVPGIAGEGIPTETLTTLAEYPESEIPLTQSLGLMFRASFMKYIPGAGFEPAPATIYPAALATGIISSAAWAAIVLPSYTSKRRKQKAKSENGQHDPDIPVLWGTFIVHFILIMALFTYLRIADSDQDVVQIYWMWFPFFYIAGTAISAYLIYFIISLKPILSAALPFIKEHDLSPEQRSIYFSYLGLQTQAVVLIVLAALLAIPHYFEIEAATSGLSVPGGAAIISAIWAYILQRRSQEPAKDKSEQKLPKLSFSMVKFGLNLLVIIFLVSSIFMIESLFEQIELGKSVFNNPSEIRFIGWLLSAFLALTQPTFSLFGLQISSIIVLIILVVLFMLLEFFRQTTVFGKYANDIANGTYYKNGFRLALAIPLTLLLVNISRNSFFERHEPLVGIIVFGVGLYTIFMLYGFINANGISLHYFYRDRIADAFLKTNITTQEGDAKTARDNRSMVLSQLNYPGSSTPYHLIMGAISLQGSKDIKLKGRKTAPFTFSKYYCGSDITGYVKTRAYRNGKTKVARAVTISGAAFSSSVGILTFFGQAFMLTLINLRLGMWFKNPKLYEEQDKAKLLLNRNDSNEDNAIKANGSENEEENLLSRFLGSIFELIETWAIWPRYLYEEAMGSMDEKLPLVNVTDGGHFENMGLYPLLQRRCKLIISGDASADPDYTANDLARVARQINVDENINVNIDLNSFKYNSRTRKCNYHYAVGEITYPPTKTRPQEKGYLIYIKPAITGDEPIDITNYWSRHKEGKFPHQSTVDQFYDEDQFEAYRHLGEHSVDKMLENIDFRPDQEKDLGQYIYERLGAELKSALPKDKQLTK